MENIKENLGTDGDKKLSKKERRAAKVQGRLVTPSNVTTHNMDNKESNTPEVGDSKKMSKKERRAAKVQGRPKAEVDFIKYFFQT